MATHQFPIGQQIHEERGSIIKRSCSNLSIGRSTILSGMSRTLLLNAHFFRKTHVDGVLRNFHVSELQSFIQAEEGTLILLHMDNETVQGHSKACDRTLDSDSYVLAVRFFETLGLSELRVGFCKRYRDIPVHSLHSDLGQSKSLALTMLSGVVQPV